MTRTLVACVVDWPAVAAGLDPAEPAVVVAANRVIAATAGARQVGVQVGLRRREAQARCPQLRVVPAEAARDARQFEPVLAALSDLCPTLEVTSPGWCSFPTRGPSRYFGGDRSLAVRVKETVEAVLAGRGVVHVGVADGRFTARVAAEQAATDSDGAVVVPAGGSPGWLADLSVSTLVSEPGISEGLVSLFRRLGLLTLGRLAALPAGQVSARFGVEGVLAHRLASGRDERPARLAVPPAEVAVQMGFETPLERAETAGFAARSLADQLEERLTGQGVSCVLLVVVAETEHGERCERRWRLPSGPLGTVVAERVRWQIDGWLNGPATGRPTSGVTVLRLVPDEVVPAGGTQLLLWGQPAAPPERVIRAVARLDGLLGSEKVMVVAWHGGRRPDQRAALVPAVTADLTSRSSGESEQAGERAPWPGLLPAPSPTVVYPPGQQPQVEVLDVHDRPLRVGGRAVPVKPAVVAVDGRRRDVVGWAGPWPLVERWWDPDRGCRQARFQVLLDDQRAYLLVAEAGTWRLAGIYD